MISTLLMVLAASAAELEATYDPVLPVGGTPELVFTSVNHDAAILVECQAGGETLIWEFPEVAAGAAHKVRLPKDPRITEAFCQVLARFANGHSEGVDVEMAWRFVAMDQEGADSDVSMDLDARVATLPAPFPAQQATVVALDSRGDPIFEQVVQLRPRSGRTTVRWTEDGAKRAAILRFTLLGPDGEQVVYDMKVQRHHR